MVFNAIDTNKNPNIILATMIQFDFKLTSKLYNSETLICKYTLEYLNDWLSYESELKYFFFFGESNNDFDYEVSSQTYPKYLEDTICLLRHNDILSNEDKQYILSLSIEDAYVSIESGFAILHIILNSEYKKHELNTKILQFLLNHIYNQCCYGIYRNGLIKPLTEEEKQRYSWNDDIGWSYEFLENNPNILDSLYFTNFTYVNKKNIEIPKPIYISNYNLECYQLARGIDNIKNDIHRYNKSIKFLEKKKVDLKSAKKTLYKDYRIIYLSMLSDDDKKWNFN